MSFEIRKYSKVDVQSLLALFHDTVHSVNGPDYTTDQLNAWVSSPTAGVDAWKDRFKNEKTLVAETDGKIVGFGGIVDNRISMLYVSKDFQSHGVEVIEHLNQDLPSVIGDSHQLQQVFLNILNNAYDAVSETGRAARIEITTKRTGNSVEILFRDNGPGITHPDRIFDPFFTTKEVGKGTGLGLSICYGIVREHGGEILCQNNTEGQGATFVVRLPATPETASVGAAAGVIQR